MFCTLQLYNGGGKSKLVILNDGSKGNTSKIVKEEVEKMLEGIIKKEEKNEKSNYKNNINVFITNNIPYYF